jgi:GAF domain-containing protein/C4-dicarboxylate-specific signal transduction histidine kinase
MPSNDVMADPQAVIAGLRAERDAALAREAALAEVLAVINRSPGDPGPVFEAILQKAHNLCGVTIGSLATYDGTYLRTVAAHGYPPDHFANTGLPFRPTAANSQRLIDGARLIHYADIAAMPAESVSNFRDVVERLGVRTVLMIPLRKDGTYVGGISSLRTEVKPFTEAEISLLESFAAQAVIAIQNARLMAEQREALEQQTATAEVLQVINASPGDLTPVFDAMLEKAMRLCGAAFGVLRSFDGERLRILASRGVPSEYAEFLAGYTGFLPAGDPPALGTSVMQALQTRLPAQRLDARESAGYKSGAPGGRAIVDLGGARTVLHVPLVKDPVSIGLLTFYRQEVRSFSDKQVALLQNFAGQAVIAMENARLLTEQREALEQQTAAAEVLEIINRSPGELTPVFDAMLEKALRLCDAAFGNLWTYDGEVARLAAICGSPPDYRAELMRMGPQRPEPGAALLRLVEGEPFIHMADIAAEGAFRSGVAVRRMLADRAGARTVLWVPMRKDGLLLGFFTIYRTEVRLFTDKQITLLQNFAGQAVIAMENARLLREQREALEQQTATAEVLQVINASPGNLVPVFDEMLEKAMRLCGAAFGSFYTYDGERLHSVAQRGVPPAYAEYRAHNPTPIRQGTGIARAIATRTPDKVLDLKATDAFTAGEPAVRAMVELGGVRTLLSVPLCRDETVVGLITIYRQEVRAFSDKQVALLQNFAGQAVIAMENARLLTEQREALEQQTATAEVLQVINASPGNLAPVFEAILEKAHGLCGAAKGVIVVVDGERFELAASRGLSEAHVELLQKAGGGYERGSAREQLLNGAAMVHLVAPVVTDGSIARFGVEHEGSRVALLVPLRRDGALLGYITAYRQEEVPFSEKQITLLQSFATQAVIAMENARLFNEVRQRQEELRVTFENMGDGVAMFDETQHLAAWNGKFQEIFDLPDILLGQRCTYEEYLQFLAKRGDFGAGVDTVEQIHELVASTGQSYGYERTRPDGRVIEIRRNPVPDGGFVLIYSDITERKRSEAEIRAARDAAEAAYRDLKAAQANLIQAEKMASLGQLTAGIAHEIKNPLNFVNNFATLSVDLLDELKATAAPGFATLDADRHAEIDELTRTLASNLEKINEHGRRADGIVRSMLDHSRGSSGERRSVDINALVDEALNLAYHGARAQDQSFNVTLRRDFGVGIAPITLAPQDITRVLLNLFGNGFYATRKRQQAEAAPSFEPTLEITTRERGDAVEIRVRDNGTGISPDIRDKLFQPFFSTKPTGEGTGLGLSISYDIVVQQHGGTIGVDSKVGQYSEFTVVLPRIR